MPGAESLAHVPSMPPAAPGSAACRSIPGLDRLTALVRRVLGVPVALVTFVEPDRQVFVSQQGLPEPFATRGETPLSHSFCQHVVAASAPLVVEDARRHPDLRHNPSIDEMGIVAYLGVPVVGANGGIRAVLCAIAPAPRAWTDDDLALLRDLADVVDDELSRRDEVERRRHAEARFRHVAEALPQLIWTATPEGRLDYVNSRWTAFSGLPRHLVKARWHRLVHPDDLERVRAGWEASVATGAAFEVEYRLRAADGAYRWFLMRAEPLVGADGRPVQWFGSCTDVHEAHEIRAQLALAAERLRLVQRATRDIVWDWDAATGELVWSPSIAETMGWEEAMAPVDLGWWAERVHPEDRARVHASFLAAFHSGEPAWQEEYRFARADGGYAFVLDRGTFVRDASGAVVRAVGAVVDLSDRKAVELELVEAREAAETAARLKSSLLANMSHEIRTPLTAILGYAEVLAAEASVGVPASEVRDYAATIERAGRRLLDTLNSVLDLAQIESGQMTLAVEPVDLLDEARAVCATLQPLADAKGLALDIEGPTAWAQADRAAVGRVLTNLVGNAIKFTRVGGVTLVVGESEGDAWVQVADTGIGMAPGFLPHVFGEFRQESEGHHRTHEGNGLGLAITKALVGQMAGRIDVHSAPGEGSRFTVHLPATEPLAAMPDPSRAVVTPRTAGAYASR